MSDSLLLQGVEEFNQGNFFEAHELWEEAWNDVVGEEKRFYQGLVQIAAGYHKLSLAQYNGARKLLERGSQTLNGFLPDSAGIDLAPLLEAVASALHGLTSERSQQDFPVPSVRLLLYRA
jgi:predicted metal-dependent hydrolase